MGHGQPGSLNTLRLRCPKKQDRGPAGVWGGPTRAWGAPVHCGHTDGGQRARGKERAGVRPCWAWWDAGSGMQAARTAQPSRRQQPCRELHKLPIWQLSPAGEGRRGPVPAAIPVSLCHPVLLPQPSCLGGGMCGGPSSGQQEGQGHGTPISCPAEGQQGWRGVRVPGSVLGAGQSSPEGGWCLQRQFNDF